MSHMQMSQATSENTLEPNERRLLQTNYPIIAIFGQSGVGKSSFINLISSEKQKVGDEDDIHSCTSRINIIEAKIRGKSVVIVDSPGIDDTRKGMSESDILAGIAQRLAILGTIKRWITGVLFLHRITDNKFGPTAQRISMMLEKLCGERAMNRVVLCTTMWDQPNTAVLDKRHARLCEDPWKDMIAQGARDEKHSNYWPNAPAAAEAIVSNMLKVTAIGALELQAELAGGKLLPNTQAGLVLTAHLGSEMKARLDQIAAMNAEMQRDKANADKLRQDIKDEQDRVRELQRQNEKLAEDTRAC